MTLVNSKRNNFQYAGKDSTFRAAYDPNTKGIDGIATFLGRRKFVLKSVQGLGHLWIEMDQDKLLE